MHTVEETSEEQQTLFSLEHITNQNRNDYTGLSQTDHESRSGDKSDSIDRNSENTSQHLSSASPSHRHNTPAFGDGKGTTSRGSNDLVTSNGSISNTRGSARSSEGKIMFLI